MTGRDRRPSPGLRWQDRVTLGAIVASAAGEVVADRLLSLTGVATSGRARRRFQRWCRATTRRLGVRVRVDGDLHPRPCVYVANHRSYLDIPVLGAVIGSAFLSRADVAGWPLVGWAARAIGSVFIDRDDPRSRAAAARALARRLRHASVVVFPEGTTTGGALPAPFGDGLFRLAQRLRVPVVPVTIRYGDRRAYWIEAEAIGEHLPRVLAGADHVAAVHVGAALDPAAYPGASELAAAAHAAVSSPILRHGELARPSADARR